MFKPNINIFSQLSLNWYVFVFFKRFIYEDNLFSSLKIKAILERVQKSQQHK